MTRVRTRRVASRRRDYKQLGHFNPLTDWLTPVHGMWADDPLWTPNGTGKTEGAAVTQVRNGGTGYTQGVYLNGTTGLVCAASNLLDCASVPDIAAYQIGGDIDIIARVTATDWTPTASKVICAAGSGSVVRFAFSLTNTGALALEWRNSSSNRSAISSVATGVTDGTAKWVRATLDVDNGAGGNTVRFYTSDDGTTWSQLGTDRNDGTGATTSINTSITGVFHIGARNLSSYLNWTGTIHRVIYKNGIDGTTVLDTDFSTVPAQRSAFVESSSNAAVVTIRSAVYPSQATSSEQPTLVRAASLNNRWAWDFDGVDDDLVMASITGINQPFYYIIIGALDTTDTNDCFVQWNTTAGLYRTDFATDDWYMSSGAVIQGGALDTNSHIHRLTINGANSAIYVDESLIASGNASTNAVNTFRIGGFGTFHPFDGKIAFVGLYNTDPSAHSLWGRFLLWAARFYSKAGM